MGGGGLAAELHGVATVICDLLAWDFAFVPRALAVRMQPSIAIPQPPIATPN